MSHEGLDQSDWYDDNASELLEKYIDKVDNEALFDFLELLHPSRRLSITTTRDLSCPEWDQFVVWFEAKTTYFTTFEKWVDSQWQDFCEESETRYVDQKYDDSR